MYYAGARYIGYLLFVTFALRHAPICVVSNFLLVSIHTCLYSLYSQSCDAAAKMVLAHYRRQRYVYRFQHLVKCVSSEDQHRVRAIMDLCSTKLTGRPLFVCMIRGAPLTDDVNRQWTRARPVQSLTCGLRGTLVALSTCFTSLLPFEVDNEGTGLCACCVDIPK